MTPAHPDWKQFYELLSGVEGCNFRAEADGIHWTCFGGFDKRFAWTIMRTHFPALDAPATMDYFEANGGHCDCEVLFNVGAE